MKKVIGIVEDEKDLNELVRSYLVKEGYDTKCFYTYHDALEYASDESIHLWLLDIMLDDKSGFDLLDAIKASNPTVPIVFMSARDKDFDRIIGLEKGSDDYITKPFSPKELVLRINNIIKRIYKSADQIIEVENYKINETQRKVYHLQDEIELTTKEFDLLMLFVKNLGVAFTREQILDRVWDEYYFGSDRVVDDTLRRLRKKLSKLNINTIYGYGYRLG
ncbi:MAG: response regulator transcription factor [Erysipelotrichaceae bacterium]